MVGGGGGSVAYLPLTGGTLTGPLTLNANPSAALVAATKGYVDTTAYPATNPAGYQTAANTAALYVPLTSKAVANGVASLDVTGKVPVLQLPAGSTGGTLNYRGGWNPITNTPVLASGALASGVAAPNRDYFAAMVTGTASPAIDGITAVGAGDWMVSNGTVWQLQSNSTGAYLPLTGGVVSGPISAPQLTVTNTGTIANNLNLGVAFAWRDGAGNIGPYIATDGTFNAGAVRMTTLAGTVTGTASLTLPQITGTQVTVPNAGTLAPADPRFPPAALMVQDGAGNVAITVDTAGVLHANVPIGAQTTMTVANATEKATDSRMPSTTYEVTDANGQGGLAITKDGRLAFNPAMGQITGPAQRTVQRKTLMTQGSWNMAASDMTSVPADPSGRTYQATITCETSGFDAVRLIFAIDNGPNAPYDTAIKAAIAVSASATDLINPVDSTGAAAPWIPAFFDNAGADIPWEKQTNQVSGSGTTRTITLLRAPSVSTLDGTTQTALNAYTLSDWIPISSFDRTDGGRWPLLYVRTYATGTTNGGIRFRILPQTSTATNFGNQVGDRIWQCYSGAGDFVATPPGFAPGTPDGHTILVAIQFYSRSRGITLMGIGDSILGGTGGGPGGIDWGVRATFELSRPEAPITWILAPTGVIQDTTPEAWITNTENMFDFVQPSIVIMESMSRNWPASQINVDRLWQRYVQMCGRLDKIGGRPIWIAPSPANMTYTAATEPFRLEIVQRCYQPFNGGQMMWDMNPTMSQHLTPLDDWIHDYTDDSLHPNMNGHNAYAGMIVKLLREATGI
jgi:hypothetical protein